MNYTLIQNWLSGKRNYTVGRVLYDQYGTDQNLKELFVCGKTDYTEKKLLEELQQIVKPTEKKKTDQYAAAEVFPDSRDKTLTSLKDRWMPLYTEMNYKRHEMDRFLNQKTDAATRRRGKLAMEILQLEKECMAIWHMRDHYLEFGKLPAPPKEDPVIDPIKLVERYKNVQGYIRRYRMYLRKDPTDPKNIAMLKKYEDEFAALKKVRAS